MNSFSLYQPENSLIHRVDPISKILYVCAAIAVPVLAPAAAAAWGCLVVGVVALITGRVWRRTFPLISFSLFILVSVVVIQGLFAAENKLPLFRIGSLTFYREGLYFALELSLRVLNILFAIAILVLTTKPSDLIESLIRRGLSPRIGYVLCSVLQIIPQMTATVNTIMDAQRSRGLETEGRLIRRLKAFFPLLGPVVINSLISARERAMALEIRGFSSRVKKTFLNEQPPAAFEPFLQWGMLLLIGLALGWRILTWL